MYVYVCMYVYDIFLKYSITRKRQQKCAYSRGGAHLTDTRESRLFQDLRQLLFLNQKRSGKRDGLSGWLGHI